MKVSVKIYHFNCIFSCIFSTIILINVDLAQEGSSETSQQQQDWSIVWACFDDPHQLLSTPGGGLSKGLQEMVRNAVTEMRRYYSRKVADVLIKVTRTSLDSIRKRFVIEIGSGKIFSFMIL